ncbi:triple gene block 2 [Yam virus Y]|nr:triple gene block 2 [Yam virus Y]
MPLVAPPDHTRTYQLVAIGASLAALLFILTRSTLPHVGDNLHHLPHGGCYQDGTKRITYRGPNSSFPSSNLFKSSNTFWAFLAVWTIVCLLHVFNRTTHRHFEFHSCSSCTSSSQ